MPNIPFLLRRAKPLLCAPQFLFPRFSASRMAAGCKKSAKSAKKFAAFRKIFCMFCRKDFLQDEGARRKGKRCTIRRKISCRKMQNKADLRQKRRIRGRKCRTLHNLHKNDFLLFTDGTSASSTSTKWNGHGLANYTKINSNSEIKGEPAQIGIGIAFILLQGRGQMDPVCRAPVEGPAARM